MNRSKCKFVTGDNRNQDWLEAGPVGSPISPSAFRGFLKLILNEDSLLRMDGDRRGTKISCAKGAVCVTQQNDTMDHILSDDEIFVVDRQGRVIIWALSASAIEIDFPETGKYCLIGQLKCSSSL